MYKIHIHDEDLSFFNPYGGELIIHSRKYNSGSFWYDPTVQSRNIYKKIV
jgi:hypothetical protein